MYVFISIFQLSVCVVFSQPHGESNPGLRDENPLSWPLDDEAITGGMDGTRTRDLLRDRQAF